MENAQGTKQADFKLRDTCNHIEGGEKAALIIFSIICILARAGADDQRFRALTREDVVAAFRPARRGETLPWFLDGRRNGEWLVQERAESAVNRQHAHNTTHTTQHTTHNNTQAWSLLTWWYVEGVDSTDRIHKSRGY